ncbi:hypothetical protein DPMN_146865 [Dreissena polymorpha]|uniref:Uncharacterized protein n=1 Tax=Dreissena polymorpha TaxID=45954 RepID=A0A9D4J2S4_DREPO|nr:hypothetical protein DPMN_146865 [Dreissena polymorpha]
MASISDFTRVFLAGSKCYSTNMTTTELLQSSLSVGTITSSGSSSDTETSMSLRMLKLSSRSCSRDTSSTGLPNIKSIGKLTYLPNII